MTQQEKVLKLTLRKKWYDLILSGEKTEEYREIKPFWIQRLFNIDPRTVWEFEDLEVTADEIKDGYKPKCPFIPFTHVHFFNGGHFGLSVPNAKFECNGITIGLCKPEWSDNAQGNHFIINIGKRVEI